MALSLPGGMAKLDSLILRGWQRARKGSVYESGHLLDRLGKCLKGNGYRGWEISKNSLLFSPEVVFKVTESVLTRRSKHDYCRGISLRYPRLRVSTMSKYGGFGVNSRVIP